MFTGLKDKRISRANYKLNKFSYCRVLNDRVRCSSLTRSDRFYYERDTHTDQHIQLQSDVVKYENRPCYPPLPAIRRWKWWLRELNRREYKNVIPCFKNIIYVISCRQNLY